MELKALTTLQPFASLIVEGGRGWADWKDVENRFWYSDHRGLLLIHAGKGKRYMKFAEDEEGYESHRMEHPKLPRMDDLPLGVILGAVQMVDCYKANPRKRRSRWEEGRWCFAFKDPIYFDEPIPAIGSQMIWTVTEEVAEKVIPYLER